MVCALREEPRLGSLRPQGVAGEPRDHAPQVARFRRERRVQVVQRRRTRVADAVGLGDDRRRVRVRRVRREAERDARGAGVLRSRDRERALRVVVAVEVPAVVDRRGRRGLVARDRDRAGRRERDAEDRRRREDVLRVRVVVQRTGIGDRQVGRARGRGAGVDEADDGDGDEEREPQESRETAIHAHGNTP